MENIGTYGTWIQKRMNNHEKPMLQQANRSWTLGPVMDLAGAGCGKDTHIRPCHTCDDPNESSPAQDRQDLSFLTHYSPKSKLLLNCTLYKAFDPLRKQIEKLMIS